MHSATDIISTKHSSAKSHWSRAKTQPPPEIYSAQEPYSDEPTGDEEDVATTTTSKRQTLIIFPLLHGALVIILTGLLATLYSGSGMSRSQKGIVDGWLLSSTRCTLWVDGMCIPPSDSSDGDNNNNNNNNNMPSAATLGGQMAEYEGRSGGLFSSVHPAFLCLAMAVLGFALQLKTGTSESSSTMDAENKSQIMKHIALVVVTVYGTIYLFMQQTWSLPVNNMLLVECVYVLGLFFVGTYSMNQVGAGTHVWLMNMLFTYPLLAVAALGAAGVDSTNTHLAVFFSLVAAGLVMLAATLDEEKSGARLLTTFWLCFLPFVVLSCVRLQQMGELPIARPAWATASLVIVLVVYLLMAVAATLHLQHGLLAGLPAGAAPLADFLLKAAVSLLIVVGIFLDS